MTWFRKMVLRYRIRRWLRAMNQMAYWMGKVQKSLGVMGAPVLKPEPKQESSIVLVGDGLAEDAPRYRRAKDVN